MVLPRVRALVPPDLSGDTAPCGLRSLRSLLQAAGHFTLELTVIQADAFRVVEIHMNAWDAHVGRALLESEGIPAFLGSEHIVTAWWPMSLVFGGVRLLVRGEDAERAKSLLASRDKGELEAALLEEFPVDPLRCSHCGSDRFSERRIWLAICVAFLLLFVARVIFPPPKNLRCLSCGELA